MTSIPTTNLRIAVPTGDENTTRLLNVPEVARRLRVGKTVLYGWLTSGRIPYHRLGRLIRIHETDVADFLSRTRVEGPTNQQYERHPQT